MRQRKRPISKDINPDEILDDADPGDETQRNFRYQHGYGVILLAAAASKQKPYTAVWCEQFEDFLCKRSDQLFDAYQIKTRKPERGHWALTDEPLRSSLKRFTKLVNRFGIKIANLYFVSNATFLDPNPDTESGKLYRSPVKFIDAVKSVEIVEDLLDPYDRVFDDLRVYCECSPLVLFATLKRLHFVVGPGRESFDAEIVEDHLAKLSGCHSLSIATLDEIRDELLRKVSEASSRRVSSPRKHWIGLDERDAQNPTLLAKKLSVELVFQTIHDVERRLALMAFSESSKGPARDIVFISHGSADDNEFTSWITLRLVGEGFNVWCNLISLKGGEDYWDEVQHIISHRSAIFLFVLSKESNTDQNALRELKLAYDVMKSEGREQFIVPLEIENIPSAEFNIFLTPLHKVVFINGWAKGYVSLLDRLEDVPKNVDSTPATANAFWESIFAPQAIVNDKPEEYYSNWFPVDLPTVLYFHELDATSINALKEEIDLPYPGFLIGDKLATFAQAEDYQSLPISNIKITRTTTILVRDVLNDEFDHSSLQGINPWNSIIQLLNLAWDQHIGHSGLGIYTLANKHLCYYFHMNYGGDKIFFQNVNHQRAWRNLMGYKTFESQTGVREKRYWHFAIQGKPILHPTPIYVIKPHVLFSDDGIKIWNSKARLHKARRSWCGDWWNAAWRDRLLASISFLADTKPSLEISVGSKNFLDIHITPIRFISPVGYIDSRDDDADVSGDFEIPNIAYDVNYLDEDEEDDWEEVENE